MRRILVLVTCLLFLSVGLLHAGVFNKVDGLKEFINTLELKTGGIMYDKVFADNIDLKHSAYYGGSLYTFQGEDSEGLFRIGTLDIGYFSENKFMVSTMIDTKILRTFKVPLPLIGDLELIGGLGLGLDLNDIEVLEWKNVKDRLLWGTPYAGLKFKF